MSFASNSWLYAPNNTIYDVLRLVVAITAFLFALMVFWLLIRPRVANNIPGDREWCLFVVIMELFVGFQEIGQLGHPLLIFRLPVFAAANIVLSRGIYRRIRFGG